MKRKSKFVVIMILLWVFLSFGSFLPQPFDFQIKIAKATASALHTDGKYIKDASENVVYLRGVNKGSFSGVTTGWWQPEGGTYGSGREVWSNTSIAYNLDKMQDLLGANALRLHLHVGYWFTNQDNYRQRIKTVCELANERGIYVIVEGFNNGAGGGAGGQSPLPWIPTNTYITGSEDFIEWWTNDTDSMSAVLGDLPNVVYEFWNEPVGILANRRTFFNACQQILTTLRNNGDDHLVIYMFGYTGWESCQDIAAGYVLNGTNVVYGIHTYRYIAHYTTYGFGPPSGHLYNSVRNIILNTMGVQNIININKPWGDFEFGAAIGGTAPVPDPENELEWYRNVMRVCNEENASYTAYEWWDIARPFGTLASSLTYPWCPPLNAAGEILKDSIAEEPPPPPPTTYQLIVRSTPISTTARVDGIYYATNTTLSLSEGNHTVSVLGNVTVDSSMYNFTQWENENTNPNRSIELSANTTITATYELVPPPPSGKGRLQIRSFLDGDEIFGCSWIAIYVDSQPEVNGTTPANTELDIGLYNVTCYYEQQSQVEEYEVLENQTTPVNFFFVTPPVYPINPGENWVISKDLTVQDETVNLPQNSSVIVNAGYTLAITNSTIYMNLTGQNNAYILVEQGGTLNLNNAKIKNGTTHFYDFSIKGQINLENCILEGLTDGLKLNCSGGFLKDTEIHGKIILQGTTNDITLYWNPVTVEVPVLFDDSATGTIIINWLDFRFSQTDDWTGEATLKYLDVNKWDGFISIGLNSGANSNVSIVAWDFNKYLTATIRGPTGVTSITKIFCGERGKPVTVKMNNRAYDKDSIWSYNYATNILTVTWTHSSDANLSIDWSKMQTSGALSDPLMQYLLQGDMLGFITGLYTRLLGPLFYGVIILLFSVPLYIKTQSFAYVCILWILLGTILEAFVPLEGFRIGWVLVIAGLAGLLYRATR